MRKTQRLKKQEGFGVIGALMALVFVGGLGVTTATLMSTDQNSRVLEWSSKQAAQVQQAGLEYAAKKSALGQNPTVNGKGFGPGNFSIARSGNNISVTSSVGSAVKNSSAVMVSNVSPPTITNGYIKYPVNEDVQLKVLCNSITLNGTPIGVKVALETNGTTSNLFNNAPVTDGMTYETSTGNTLDSYRIKGTAMLNPSVSYWSNNTVQARTLMNGSSVPSVPGFDGQESVSECVQGYVKNGKISLAKNQVIVLFELGVSGNSSSSANDFQDLVVLMTGTGT